MKLDLGKIIGIVGLVQSAVNTVQQNFAGKKTGAEKKEAVVVSLKELLPIVETGVGKDLLDDAQFNAALSTLIDAEKAVLNARAAVAALIANARARKAIE